MKIIILEVPFVRDEKSRLTFRFTWSLTPTDLSRFIPYFFECTCHTLLLYHIYYCVYSYLIIRRRHKPVYAKAQTIICLCCKYFSIRVVYFYYSWENNKLLLWLRGQLRSVCRLKTRLKVDGSFCFFFF